MVHSYYESVFYQVYPLGFCGAPFFNDFNAAPACRLGKILDWIEHLKHLGINTLYLGPLFESSTHGYDTADYYVVDRRLGTNEDLKHIIAVLHENGIKVVLDAVFNHVGRDFWAFKDVQAFRENSRYRYWFSGLDFQKTSPYQDMFSYDCWNSCFNLIKLDVTNQDVKDHLFGAVKMWIDEFQIDGLRLDAADCLDLGFISDLSAACKIKKPDFWLMGEVIHGDYGRWVKAGLDSVTNYECYKGLWSSHNDANYFEIAYSLNRQFGESGIYKDFLPYSFADNHDVDRVASILKNKRHLFPLYILLFTMPGIPSIYYGSEWGIDGKKGQTSDDELRPSLDLASLIVDAPMPGLEAFIEQLSRIRRSSQALKQGSYQQVLVNHQQFAFTRRSENENVIVAINSAEMQVSLELHVPSISNGSIIDVLNNHKRIEVIQSVFHVNLPPNWGRILKFVQANATR